jgi:hypothetical protein
MEYFAVWLHAFFLESAWYATAPYHYCRHSRICFRAESTVFVVVQNPFRVWVFYGV